MGVGARYGVVGRAFKYVCMNLLHEVLVTNSDLKVGGFISLVDQYWVAWLTAILFGALLIAEILFLPETLYPRKLMLSHLPTTAIQSTSDTDPEKPAVGAVVDIKRTKDLPFINFQKVPGVEHPKPWDAFLQFCKMWSFPNIAISVFFYCFAWLVLFTTLPRLPKLTETIKVLVGVVSDHIPSSCISTI